MAEPRRKKSGRKPAALKPRVVPTPFGDASLTSRWVRDRYYFRASGPIEALGWMFPGKNDFETLSDGSFRRSFRPHPNRAVQSHQDLHVVAEAWCRRWEGRLQDYQEGTDKTQVSNVDQPTILTLGQLVDHLLEIRGGDRSTKSLLKEKHYLKGWLDQLGRGTALVIISDQDLRQARSRLSKRLAPSTVNCSFATLKTYLRWAHQHGYIPALPYEGIKPLKTVSAHNKIQWWTPEEIVLALNCAEKKHNQATAMLLIAVGCYAGLRWEEMIMQRWQDVELDRVNQATGEPEPLLHVVPHGTWKPKDSEGRTVPICYELAAVLQRFRQRSGYLLKPERNMPKRGGVNRVYRYNPLALWESILAAAVQAGAKKITPHGMRHSFASNLLNAGLSDVKVARWLGHADTTMVHQHYGHLMAYDDDINRGRRQSQGKQAVSTGSTVDTSLRQHFMDQRQQG